MENVLSCGAVPMEIACIRHQKFVIFLRDRNPGSGQSKTLAWEEPCRSFNFSFYIALVSLVHLRHFLVPLSYTHYTHHGASN